MERYGGHVAEFDNECIPLLWARWREKTQMYFPQRSPRWFILLLFRLCGLCERLRGLGLETRLSYSSCLRTLLGKFRAELYLRCLKIGLASSQLSCMCFLCSPEHGQAVQVDRERAGHRKRPGNGNLICFHGLRTSNHLICKRPSSLSRSHLVLTRFLVTLCCFNYG